LCFRCRDGYGYDMLASGFILTTNAQIDTAIFNNQPVTVWMEGRIVDDLNVIETHNEETVKINGEYYSKAACEFRVR
jgi:hypothetical protein